MLWRRSELSKERAEEIFSNCLSRTEKGQWRKEVADRCDALDGAELVSPCTRDEVVGAFKSALAVAERGDWQEGDIAAAMHSMRNRM